MSRELANPAHAAQWLRRVLAAMRGAGVDVLRVADLEQALNDYETRGSDDEGRTGSRG